MLRVTAREQRTGAEASIQIVPSFGLTRDEVRRMMLDSIENAQADYQAREAIDVIVTDLRMVGMSGMELLQQAGAHGCIDLVYLQEHEHLRALRALPGYDAVLRQVAANVEAAERQDR